MNIEICQQNKFPHKLTFQTDENLKNIEVNFIYVFKFRRRPFSRLLPAVVTARRLRLIYGDHLLFIVHFGLCRAGNSCVSLHLVIFPRFQELSSS